MKFAIYTFFGIMYHDPKWLLPGTVYYSLSHMIDVRSAGSKDIQEPALISTCFKTMANPGEFFSDFPTKSPHVCWDSAFHSPSLVNRWSRS